MEDFDTEPEWLADRNDQWKKLRNKETDEDTLASRGSLLGHPDIDEVRHAGRGWQVAHGVTGPRKRVSFLVRKRGARYETIHPPVRSAWSKDGPDTQWTITQEGEGPIYKRKAGSLLDAVGMADTPPGRANAVSEDPYPNNPSSSEGMYERDKMRDVADERLWNIKPILQWGREARVAGAVSRASDTVWNGSWE